MKQILLPVVVDIETSGTSFTKSGIWQIGAVDLNTMEEFLGESKIDKEDQIITHRDSDRSVLEVIGKTERELRDETKQSQKELLEKFFKWIINKSVKNFICQNPQFDISFFEIRSEKYNLKMPFHHRVFDLHTIAQLKYYKINKEFSIKKEDCHSSMGLSEILKFCGIKDNRKVHNALEDARLTAECFYRLIFGKNLFPAYSKFKVPEELKK